MTTQVQVSISGICAFFTSSSPPRMLMINARDVRNTANSQEVIESHVAAIRWPVVISPTVPAGADIISADRNYAAVLLRGEFIRIVSSVIAETPVFTLPNVPLFHEVAGDGYTLKAAYAEDDYSKLKAADVVGRIDFHAGIFGSTARDYLWHFFPSALKEDVKVAQEISWTFNISEDYLTLELVEFETGATRQIRIDKAPSLPMIKVEICNCMEADLFPDYSQPIDTEPHSPDWHFELYYRMYEPPANAKRPAVPYSSGWFEEKAVAATQTLHGGNCPPLKAS